MELDGRFRITCFSDIDVYHPGTCDYFVADLPHLHEAKSLLWRMGFMKIVNFSLKPSSYWVVINSHPCEDARCFKEHVITSFVGSYVEDLTHLHEAKSLGQETGNKNGTYENCFSLQPPSYWVVINYHPYQEAAGCFKELCVLIPSLKGFTILDAGSLLKFIARLPPTQIARCDWLPERARWSRARWSHLARSGLPAVSPKEILPEGYIINPLLTKLFRSRWLDIGHVLFLGVYGPELRLGP